MSTYAAIFMEREDGLYDGVTVKYDGYISGVGKVLFENWTDEEEIKDLVSDQRTDIRILNKDKETTEYFDDEMPGRKDRWSNLDKKKMLSQGSQCDYTYLWKNGEWHVKTTGNFKKLSKYIEAFKES